MLVLVALIALAAIACGRVANPDGWSAGVIVDDTLYTGSMDGALVAMDAATGAPIWQFDNLVGDERRRAFYGDPVVDVEGGVLFAAGYDGYLYAVTLSDGSSLWEVPVGVDEEAMVGGPGYGNGVLVVGSSDGAVYAFDSRNGSELWRFETESMVWTTPLVDEGVVYFGSLDKTIYALTLKGGDELWTFSTGGAVTSPILKVGNRLFVGAFDGVFYALDAATGSEIWRFDGATGWYWARAAATDTMVYAPSLDGNVYALSSVTGDLQWTLETDGPIIGAPAVVDGFLVVASDDGKLRTVTLVDGDDERRCNIDQKLRTNVVSDGRRIYLGAWDKTIRSLEINDVNQLDEKWVYKTDRPGSDNPISDDPSWEQSC